MKEKNISQRSRDILRALIARYIREGQPVGSRTLAESTGSHLSSATIRNVLADLEDNGYLTSPHTSAGRVPTARGFRVFVDGLTDVKPLEQKEIDLLSQTLNPDADIAELMGSASTLLANITQMAGLVKLPRQNRVKLRHVEFLPLSGNRVLAILVFNGREVQNRIIYTDRPYSASELQQAANYLSEHYNGRELLAIHQLLLASLQEDRSQMDRLMQTVIEMASKTFEQPEPVDDYVLAGESNLLSMTEVADIESLRSLFNAFTQKQAILHLLDRCLQSTGVQIFIGEESGYEGFDNCSVVTSSYAIGGEVLGVLGVIGPKRMDYARVIPAVDITAKLLGAALSSHHDNDNPL